MSGGWLRPAVFGAMDGLVTNIALVAGVGGGGRVLDGAGRVRVSAGPERLGARGDGAPGCVRWDSM